MSVSTVVLKNVRVHAYCPEAWTLVETMASDQLRNNYFNGGTHDGDYVSNWAGKTKYGDAGMPMRWASPEQNFAGQYTFAFLFVPRHADGLLWDS